MADDPTAQYSVPSTQSSALFHRIDWLLIGLLFALVLPLRLWLLCNTEVTARDSIGYIRYALQFEQYSWKEVLTKNHQHPGYPVLVWAMSHPVRAIDGATTPDNMELSAQLVNLVASLVLMLPMYWLGRLFFDRPVCFFATLLYQYLPISAQHLSDGISEPTYLVLLVSGLLQAVHAIRARSVWNAALCGVFTGLAYLTRPEGALIVPAFGIVLLATQVLPAWRCSTSRFLACGAALVLSVTAVGSIYFLTTGKFSNKPAAKEIMKQVEISPIQDSDVGGHLFAATFPRTEQQPVRTFRSVWALVTEVNQGFHYLAGLPALLGLIWSFKTMRYDTGFWFIAAYVVLHGAILVTLAMTASYVSDRHVMILVLLGCYFAVFGLRELPRRVLAWYSANQPPEVAKWYRSAPLWFSILYVALIAFCLPKATQRLHGNRAGNHDAGVWLSEHLGPNDLVLDDHSWSHFFSGLLFQEGREAKYPEDHRSRCFIVTTRGRDRMFEIQRESGTLEPDAEVVYVWPRQSDINEARVVIHVQPRQFAKHPWPRP